MDEAVDACGQLNVLLLGELPFGHLLEHGTQLLRHHIGNAPFVAEDAGPHVVQIVLLRLLPVGIVALELKLGGLEIVAGIVFVGNRQWHEMQAAQILTRVGALTAQIEHAQERILRLVGRVLRTAFSLRNPNVLMLLANGVVHVAAHESAALQAVFAREGAAHDEGLVHLHQRLDPRIDEQVVANGNLAGGAETGQMQLEVENGRIEHDVAVVGDEGVGALLVEIAEIGGDALGAFVQDVLHDGLHETQLEVERRLHPDEEHAQQRVPHGTGQPRHQPAAHTVEVAVGQERRERSLHLAGVVGPDDVKFVSVHSLLSSICRW